jgi:hypothetical protein
MGGVYLLAAALVYGAAGNPRDANTVWVDITYAAWFAWVPIALTSFVRGVERDALALAPILGAEGPARETLRREALAVSPRALWLGAAVGFLFFIGVIGFAFGALERPPTGGVAIFLGLREFTVEIAVFSVVGWGVGAAARLSQLTSERARANLLDLSGFRPLTRNASRLALLWLIVNAIGLPVLIAPPAAVSAEAMRSVLAMFLVPLIFVVGALVIPTEGARRVIRAAKSKELARVRGQIADARREREDERLPGLLAWESRVAGVAERPIDAATLRRVGLFLFIPLGSWVCGALVERLVETYLF